MCIAMLKFLHTDHFKRYGWWIVGRHVVFRCTNELVTHITANDNHNCASKITDHPQGLVYESLKRRLFFRILRPDLIHGDFLKCKQKKNRARKSFRETRRNLFCLLSTGEWPRCKSAQASCRPIDSVKCPAISI